MSATKKISRSRNREVMGSFKIELFSSMVNAYRDYAVSQSKLRMLWYLKVILIIPCVVMVPSIFVMSWATDHYVWFIGFTVVLFFTNLAAYISETKSTFFVPLYHATILTLILVPFITLFLNS